jgi:hypothetical protein
MKRKAILAAVLCCLSVATAPALAGDTPALTRVGDVGLFDSAGAAGAKADCVLGNPNPPAGSVPGFFTGDEQYWYLIYPPEQCSCEEGFLLESVTMLLEFDASMLPANFEVVAELGDAVWDDNSQCFVPGEPLCVSSPVSFFIDVPGIYELTVPMDQCQCAHMNYHYFIGLNFLSGFSANLVIDEFPEPCVNWNRKLGGGWEDLFNWLIKTGGKVIIWGDVICCPLVIPNEPDTWGNVKSLYR